MALLQGVTNALTSPAPTSDGGLTPNAQRMGKYNELYALSMFPTKHLAALAGNYYSITVATATNEVTSLSSLTEMSQCYIETFRAGGAARGLAGAVLPGRVPGAPGPGPRESRS